MTAESRLTARQKWEQARAKWLRGVLGGAALCAAALLATLPLSLALGVVGAGALVAVAIAAPVVGLYLLPLAVAFGSLTAVNLGSARVGPTDLLVGALCVAWAARNRGRVWVALRRPQSWPERLAAVRRRWERNRLRVCVLGTLLVYLAVIFASSLVASDRAVALKEGVKWMETVLVLALALWLLQGPGHVRLVIWLVIAVGVAEALVGLGQWVAGAGLFSAGLRASGTFDQPNPYAGYLNLALAPALALAAFGEDERERWVAAGVSLLLLSALTLSGSRGGLLGLAAAVCALMVVDLRRERLAVVVAVVGIPLFALAWLARVLPAGLPHALRLDDLVPGGSVTAANFSAWERLAHWAAGADMFWGNPVLGVGAGNYAAAYARYTPDLATWPEALGHAHNYYINAAAETGLLGLLAFCAFTVAALFTAWRSAHDARAGGGVLPRALALGLFAALLALTVHNLTDDLFVHAMELQIALYVGCTLAQAPRACDGSVSRGLADGTHIQWGERAKSSVEEPCPPHAKGSATAKPGDMAGDRTARAT